ncbi:MAG: signal peptidase I [Oscillospiraceae bacterium]|nr:signal peptidase I [Oscillospiraceae bacterium]
MQQTEQQDIAAKTKPKKQRSPMNPIQTFLLNALIIVTVVWLLFGYVFGLMPAPNDDMAPNIRSGDLLLYYRLNKSVQPQDVVVLRKNGTTYVARVIAAGGDTVEVTDDARLVINGNAVSETNIYTSTPRYEGFVEYPLTVPADSFFVLADHRSGSEDSRYYGTVSKDELLGRIITVVRRDQL